MANALDWRGSVALKRDNAVELALFLSPGGWRYFDTGEAVELKVRPDATGGLHASTHRDAGAEAGAGLRAGGADVVAYS
ncbi:hypothetical protein EYF80_003018 [Liparis tanakae]|uniref:Uncharacterized protein n=1 Tax=Liparis tanakae TaxID=230148 RepID=A0A4Z2J8Z1_9TELE|nr:hypothetical protein EYF80_003018 [Liparis tanakae]